MSKIDELKPRSMRFNLTPLIDVTFLLIVFFVMSSKMIKDEVAMELTLPRESSGETVENDEKNKIVLNVEQNGTVYLGVRRVDLAELRTRLREEKERGTRDASVRIRADRSTPYRAIEPILVVCAQTGFTDVSFAVVDK